MCVSYNPKETLQMLPRVLKVFPSKRIDSWIERVKGVVLESTQQGWMADFLFFGCAIRALINSRINKNENFA
jgi:hypothetical protein